MKILFSPQVRDNDRIKYTFKADVIGVEHKGKTDVFDFADFAEGKLEIYDEDGNTLIETTLDEQPIRSAERKSDGTLYVELMNYIGLVATESERFPEWIDHTEYEPPVEEDSNGEDDMETES